MKAFLYGLLAGGAVAGVWALRDRRRWETEGAALQAALVRDGGAMEAALRLEGGDLEMALRDSATTYAETVARRTADDVLATQYGLTAARIQRLQILENVARSAQAALVRSVL